MNTKITTIDEMISILSEKKKEIGGDAIIILSTDFWRNGRGFRNYDEYFAFHGVCYEKRVVPRNSDSIGSWDFDGAKGYDGHLALLIPILIGEK